MARRVSHSHEPSEGHATDDCLLQPGAFEHVLELPGVVLEPGLWLQRAARADVAAQGVGNRPACPGELGQRRPRPFPTALKSRYDDDRWSFSVIEHLFSGGLRPPDPLTRALAGTP